MVDFNALPPLGEVAAWTNSDQSWGPSFLERPGPDGHDSRAWIDHEPRIDNLFERQIEQATQFLTPVNRKRKRDAISSSAVAGTPQRISIAPDTGVVVYGANGHRRGTENHKDKPRSARERATQEPRNKTDLERAGAILTILPGIIAILRYECGCTSPQGVCNHHSFSSGLTLPDGVICAGCKTQANIHEIKVTRKCPPHSEDEYHADRQRLRRLGYSEESIEMNVPTVPALIQDYAATREQLEICNMHLASAMSGTQSTLGAVIRSWSREQRSYYQRHRVHLRKFPRIFSGERVKW